MKITRKLTYLILLVLLVSHCAMAFSACDETENRLEYKEPIYIDHDRTIIYDYSKILVVLDHSISKVNQEIPREFWGDIGEAKITDLTRMSGDIDSKKYLNKDKFCQIFCIELEDCSKENVLRVIEELKKIEGVRSAEVNALIPID